MNNMTKGLAFERNKFSILHNTHEIKYSDCHYSCMSDIMIKVRTSEVKLTNDEFTK